MATKKSAKVGKKFHCETCDYICYYNSDYIKHLMTRKHKLATNSNIVAAKNSATHNCGEIISSKNSATHKDNEIISSKNSATHKDNEIVSSKNSATHKCGDIVSSKNSATHICEYCNKEYQDRSGLWRHKKICSMYQGDCELINSTVSSTPTSNIDIEKLTDLFKHMLTQNQDFMTDIVEKVMPKIGDNNSHNTNSLNTNNFNIQMFLNDHCKNAMNLTDFIQSLPITSETYDSTIANGLTKTITSMMVNGLNDLDILERPIHCTDASRKTLYVKDSDNWEKDNELLHIMKGIKELSLKQRTLISKWKEVNKGWDKDDNLQSKMTNLVFNSMTQIENDEKETNKIIKTLSKKVYLDNETKKCYV